MFAPANLTMPKWHNLNQICTAAAQHAFDMFNGKNPLKTSHPFKQIVVESPYHKLPNINSYILDSPSKY
jgi:hypothetical protein